MTHLNSNACIEDIKCKHFYHLLRYAKASLNSLYIVFLFSKLKNINLASTPYFNDFFFGRIYHQQKNSSEGYLISQDSCSEEQEMDVLCLTSPRVILKVRIIST